MKFSILYVLTIVLINMSFAHIEPIILYDGTMWSVGSVIAGAVFVVRDYAQKEVGHKLIFIPMVTAAALSYVMASPFIATASLLAFSASEVCDYLAFTFKKGSFKSKVITSSMVSVPVDTVIFLSVISHLSWFSFAVMCASKVIVLSYLVVKK